MKRDELIPRADWPKLYREGQFQRQIVLRSRIADEMVGSLYPRILGKEISDLLELARVAKRAKRIIDQTLTGNIGTIQGLIYAIELELPHLTVRIDTKTIEGGRAPEPSDCVITVDKGELDTPEKEARIHDAIRRVAPVALLFELREEP